MNELGGWLRGQIDVLSLPVIMAYIGRLAWHASEVQRGRRRWWSAHLVWELIAAVAIGLVADGVASHLGLSGAPRTAAIVAIAYLGPRGIEALVIRILDSRRGGLS